FISEPGTNVERLTPDGAGGAKNRDVFPLFFRFCHVNGLNFKPCLIYLLKTDLFNGFFALTSPAVFRPAFLPSLYGVLLKGAWRGGVSALLYY
ncbi:MAG: hypothetical protein FWD39_02940, partial [Clostridiales bacterium]|nr:hypothetical protein [Clostridiales bacterium]